MSEYNITWAKQKNEDLEYENEKLKYKIKELEKRNLKLIHENIIWSTLCMLAIMALIVILFK